MKRKLRPVRFVVSAVLFATASLTPPVSAQSVTNLAGTWNNIMFSTPARLTLMRDWIQFPNAGTDYALREIPERDYFDMSTGQITAQADGNFTGFATGTFSLDPGGRMVVSVPSNAPITFHMNAAADFMYSLKHSDEGAIQDLELLLKAPATMTGAEMAGTWKSVSFGTPARLVLQKEPLSNTYVTNIGGADDFHVNTGTVTVNDNGTLTVNDSGEIIQGTYAPGGPGTVDVTLNIPGMGAFTLHFFVNASKNVMAALNPMDPASHELILLLKQPAQAVTTDFKGLWRAGTFTTPRTLTPERTFYGVIKDIQERNDFEFSIGPVNVGHTGTFTLPTEPAYGLATITGPGTIQALATNSFGEVNTDTFWVNAAKDVMVTVRSDGDHSITLATRAPAETVRSESMGMMLVGTTVFWASDTNRALQVSTNLNDWAVVPNTAGQSSFHFDPTATTNGFFRVMGTP